MSRPDTPPYFRVAPRFWGDERVKGWSDDTRLFSVYCITSPHRTLEGIFICPVHYMVADLGWTAKKVGAQLAILETSGFLKFDSATSLLLIRNALKYQFPENPNQIKGAIRRIKDLPNSPLLQEFQELVRKYCYRKGAGSDVQGFPYLLDQALSERFPQQLAQPLGQSLTLSPSQAQTKTQTQTPTPTRRNGVEEGTSFFSLSGEEREKESGILARYPFLAETAQ